MSLAGADTSAPLQGKCALITGSTSGLGLSMAKGLAAAGASVILNGLCPADEGLGIAENLADTYGSTVAFDGADLSQRTEIEQMIATAEQQFGGVDILINNAVVRNFAPLETFDPDAWEHALCVNLTAPFHTARLCLPSMKQKGWGRIINISSYYGWRGAENRVDYVTTKTGLLGLTRAIAIETAKAGITCNAICPGTVATEAILQRIRKTAADTGEPFEELAQKYAAARNPSGRFVAPDSISAMIVFLCGPAGNDINGVSLPIDGGWLAA